MDEPFGALDPIIRDKAQLDLIAVTQDGRVLPYETRRCSEAGRCYDRRMNSLPRSHATAATAALALLFATASPAAPTPPAPRSTRPEAVRVILGPTPIPGGSARAAHDLTVENDRLAFSIAVDSPVPYGVPRGALVDLAKVDHGRIGHDHVVFADFIPNAWSAWPNTYRHVEVLDDGPTRVVIRSERDWGQVVITTRYTLEAGSDHIRIDTVMRNGGRRALRGLLSGMTLWPNSGFLFGVPGVASCRDGTARGALADHVVAYDAHWSIALHAPYLGHVASGCRDLFVRHDLAAGASRAFHASLQVDTRGDLAPVEREDLGGAPAGQVEGIVRGADGRPVAAPVVIAERRGVPFAWAYGRDGRYALDLPPGRYRLYATARHASQSAATDLQLAAGAHLRRDFSGIESAGQVHLTVADAASGAPLDARIRIVDGERPVVQFLGRRTFFTDLDRKGEASFALAPGRYRLDISAGGGFLGPDLLRSVTVEPGGSVTAQVRLERWFAPEHDGWYAADLHHHADQAEAVTPPQFLARSQLAAGLDLLFVSDHDSTVNHLPLERIAKRRGIPFLASVELSASWGHFNAYPLRLGAPLEVNTATATIQQLIAEAHRLGATVFQVNHPFIPYGYFTSLAAGTAPGGFDPAFDLVEINAAAPEDDARVFATLERFWNAGDRYYLAAGTDTHDVWNEVSGRVRTFAHVPGRLSAARFADALRAGHAYVSYGPLIEPATMFGDDLKVATGGRASLGFDLASVAGLARLTLIQDGVVIARQAFDGAPRHAHVELPVTVAHDGWAAVTVEDARGRMAYSDPIWLDAVAPPADGARTHH